jgi:uncharacterized oxidoreductase
MNVAHDRLKRLVTRVFAAAGCREAEAERVGHYLVEANLVGHDSHGVIRVPYYVRWLGEGKVRANQELKVVFENDVLVIADGQRGFGQVMGEGAMRLGVARASRQGVAVVALRNSGHLGRIGDWAEAAARAGKVSLHFVNTSGAGILVPPHGGINRRLSANPIAAGVPVEGGPPLIVDISTSAIAEGKLKVALNKGAVVPDNCIIDAQGRPTNDPRVFYADPPGAILPFGGHKGYALGMLAEVLAGALTGGGCSDPRETRVLNSMFTVVMDPAFFQADGAFAAEVRRFIDFVRSATPAAPGGEILMPGEPEERTRRKRLAEGIDLDETTWGQIAETCRSLNVAPDEA